MIKEAEVQGTIDQVKLSGPEREQQLISNINAIITSYSSDSEIEEKSFDSEAELQAEEEQVSVLMLRLPTEIDAEKVKPSIEDPPMLELKPLPDYLKYAFLGPNNTLSIIISSKLDQE